MGLSAGRNQRGAQFGAIVDASIEHEAQLVRTRASAMGLMLVRGLGRGAHCGVPHCDGAVEPGVAAVHRAMRNRIEHPRHKLRIGGLPIEVVDDCDAAH